MARSDEMDAVYDCDFCSKYALSHCGHCDLSVYGPLPMYEDCSDEVTSMSVHRSVSSDMSRSHPQWRYRHMTPPRPPDPVRIPDGVYHEEKRIDWDEKIVALLAASIRHIQRLTKTKWEAIQPDITGLNEDQIAALYEEMYLLKSSQPWGPKQRAGAFATDLRRGLREYAMIDLDATPGTPGQEVYRSLINQLACADKWADAGVLHSHLTANPTPDTLQLMEWLERANQMAEPDTVEDLAERLKKLKLSLPGLDTHIRAVAAQNDRASVLLGQIDAVLDGEDAPATSTLSANTFIREHLPQR